MNSYIKTFSWYGFHEQRRAIEPFAWSGISSPRHYDVIGGKLVNPKNAESKSEIEAAAWLAMTLVLLENEKVKNIRNYTKSISVHFNLD